MEIKPPSSDLYSAIGRSVSASTQSNLPSSVPPDWKVTQLIQAVITQITDKQLFLDIQGVKANTLKPNISDLQIGDILKLQIEQLKPMPQFRIISMQKAINANLLSQALKNSVTQNISTTPLLKNISFIANRPALRPSPLSVDVNAAVREIFKHLPSPFNLKTATQVKNQLQNSGAFLESNIKNQILSVIQNTQIKKTTQINSQLNSNIKSVLELDLGAQLHRLASLIRTQLVPVQNATPLNPQQNMAKSQNIISDHKVVQQQATRAPTEQTSLQNITQREEAMHTFLRQIESSLTHMQQTQLQNLNESQPGRPLWLMELPIKDGQDIDLFELRITEEESTERESESKKIWNVTLKFDLTGLGTIKAHIKMQNDIISTRFFSEKTEVLALFQDNLDFLRNRLNYNGLNVGNIECVHAKLSEEVILVSSTRLDERT